MTASQNGTAPQIDVRDLMSGRKRTLAAARKACKTLAGAAEADSVTLENGGVPDAAAFRKAADKYARLLDTLNAMDSLLTPEALAAIHLEHEEPVLPPALRVEVSREDLEPLVGFVTGMVPDGPQPGTPLGRLTAALNGMPGALLTLPAAPAVPEPDPGFPPQGS